MYSLPNNFASRPKIVVGDWESEFRSQNSGVRIQESEFRSQKPEFNREKKTAIIFQDMIVWKNQ